MGEGQRGATLEGIIARYRIINPYLRILGLSATLGNPEEIATWLQAGLYQSSSRPVPLEWRIATFEAKRTGAKGKETIAAQEALATKQEGGQSIVFVQSRPRSEGLAKSLSEAGIRAEAHHAGLPLRKRKASRRGTGPARSMSCVPPARWGLGLTSRPGRSFFTTCNALRVAGGTIFPSMKCGNWAAGPVDAGWMIEARWC